MKTLYYGATLKEKIQVAIETLDNKHNENYTALCNFFKDFFNAHRQNSWYSEDGTIAITNDSGDVTISISNEPVDMRSDLPSPTLYAEVESSVLYNRAGFTTVWKLENNLIEHTAGWVLDGPWHNSIAILIIEMAQDLRSKEETSEYIKRKKIEELEQKWLAYQSK